MKCWKCGQENSDGVSTCLYCGASQSRVAAATEVGRAMRKLYDHYGCKTVLSNSAYLVNGLGDLTEDSKKLRNQIKMAMDAGMGRLYLEQLSVGHPDAGFQERIKMLLTEDAGLNDGTAKQLMGYFNEMIGWKVVQIPKKQTPRPKVPPKPNPKPKPHYEQKRAGSDEIRRDTLQAETQQKETVHNAPYSTQYVLVQRDEPVYVTTRVKPYDGSSPVHCFEVDLSPKEAASGTTMEVNGHSIHIPARVDHHQVLTYVNGSGELLYVRANIGSTAAFYLCSLVPVVYLIIKSVEQYGDLGTAFANSFGVYLLAFFGSMFTVGLIANEISTVLYRKSNGIKKSGKILDEKDEEVLERTYELVSEEWVIDPTFLRAKFDGLSPESPLIVKLSFKETVEGKVVDVDGRRIPIPANVSINHLLTYKRADGKELYVCVSLK